MRGPLSASSSEATASSGTRGTGTSRGPTSGQGGKNEGKANRAASNLARGVEASGVTPIGLPIRGHGNRGSLAVSAIYETVAVACLCAAGEKAICRPTAGAVTSALVPSSAAAPSRAPGAISLKV